MSDIKKVDANTLKKWIDSNEAVLIDVRDKEEYDSECIEFAKSLPLNKITIEDAKKPENKNKKVVIQCQFGSRAIMACEKIKSYGADFDIWYLDGGIDSWKKEGFPMKESENKIFPLNQQVQIATGIIIVTGIFLTHFVNYIWILFPLFVGLGLINAGVSGWCGLGKLMLKMPWNKFK